MSSSNPSHVTLDKYKDDDFLSSLLRLGLFLGAIFQIVCIVSSIFLPASNGAYGIDSDGVEEHKSFGATMGRLQNKNRKQEKKKRR